jgi:penicillin-binding protein 2
MSQALIDQMFPINTSIAGNTTMRTDRYDYFPKPLYNYATMSLLPSGSTFKPITAVAGLQEGVIDANTTVNDLAQYNLGDATHPDMVYFKSDGPHYVTNIVKAITVSSNPFFMEVGKLLRAKLGADGLAKYAWQFGMGADPNGPTSNASTGIEIPENFGQVFNTVSLKNNNANMFLINAEGDLNSGVSISKGKLPVINLYDNSGDSKNVASIKTEIKNDFKNEVKKPGIKTVITTDFKTLFNNLIASDPIYKGKKLSNSDINCVVAEITNQIMAARNDIDRPYHSYESAIGQDMDAFTPLQIADYMATLANGGTRYKSHLLDQITDSNGNVVEKVKPQVLNTVQMTSETKSLVSEGMNGVTDAGAGGMAGTAAQALGDFNNYVPTAGKTGTAEFGENPDLQTQIGRADYAWFAGYAPATNPQISVAVVIFDGGYGADAANVARNVYEAYFKTQLQQKGYKFDIGVNAQPEN